MAAEKIDYQVKQQDGRFEIRQYPAQIVAETLVEGGFEEVGGTGFKRLFAYISADGREGKKIAMTSPVTQQRSGNGWAIHFYMPATYRLAQLPPPQAASIQLKQIPARRLAAVRYAGFWNQEGYDKHKAKLQQWLRRQGINVTGEAIWARYNAPFVPWFMRRNEVWLPVAEAD